MSYTVTSASSTKKQDTIEEGIRNDSEVEVVIQTLRPLCTKS